LWFLKAGPRKKFCFKPVRSAKKVADPWFTPLTGNMQHKQLIRTGLHIKTMMNCAKCYEV